MAQSDTKATEYQAAAKPAGKTINGTDKRDWLFGTNGNDEIHGSGGDDVIVGLGGNDTLYGNDGNDKLSGSLGDDLLDGGAGLDQMAGGSGNDTYMVDDAGDTVTESKNQGIDTVRSSIDYTLGANVENLVLAGDAAINGTGNALDNAITGNSADNTLYGNAGNDTFYSNAGNDTLDGGTGNDTYIFALGAGNDSLADAGADDTTTDNILFESSVHKETIALFQSGNDIVIGYASTDTVTVLGQSSAGYGVEKVELGDGLFLTNADIARVIQDITKFAADNGIVLSSIDDVRNNQDLMNIIANAWHE